LSKGYPMKEKTIFVPSHMRPEVKELCGRIEIGNQGSLSHWVAVDEIITQDKRRDFGKRRLSP